MKIIIVTLLENKTIINIKKLYVQITYKSIK